MITLSQWGIGIFILLIWTFTRNNIANVVIGIAFICYCIWLLLTPGLAPWLMITFEVLAAGIALVSTVRLMRA